MGTRTALILIAIAAVIVRAAGGIRAAPQQGQSNRAMQVIEEAAAALGGKERILAVRTLTIEGYGSNPNIGQAMTPEADPLLWMLPDYRRGLDLENNRMEMSFTRRPAFPAVFDNARQVQRLDGDVAYNLPAGRGGGPGGAAAAPARLGDQVARDRRIEMLQHPLTIVRAALAPVARVTNLRRNGRMRSVDVATAHGDVLTLTVDALGRPVSVRTAVYHQNLGDTERVTTFGAYENLDGIRLPKRIVTRLDRWVEYDIGVMKNTLDADLRGLAAPEATRNGAPPAQAAPVSLTATMVAKGIWFVTGGGNPTLIVEFADHVALVEVAGNDARVQALLAKANELVPDKPVTQAIVTHHHFDHTGGLRSAVAQGLTIITHRINEAWFKEAVARRHTIVADALARAPRPLKMVTFDDSYTIADADVEMVLYHLANSTHGDGILSVYFPRERLYAEVDVWNPGAQIQPHVRSLAEEIARRRLQIDRIIPLHGTQVQPYAELEKVVAEWSTRRATTTTFVAPGEQR
ncbi:MAG: MBL fold metallo-hydrolase [Acidobacteria bacterium]|nr:MBL fold metallo-hydrolase [Acidobacteriota bacterium]